MLASHGDEPPDQEHPLQQLSMAALSYYDGLDEQLKQETGMNLQAFDPDRFGGWELETL